MNRKVGRRKTTRAKRTCLNARQRLLLETASRIAAAMASAEGYKFPIRPIVIRALQSANLLLESVERPGEIVPVRPLGMKD